MGWVLFVVVVVVAAAGLWWYFRSFKRWPPTEGERKSFFWGARGGGDL